MSTEPDNLLTRGKEFLKGIPDVVDQIDAMKEQPCKINEDRSTPEALAEKAKECDWPTSIYGKPPCVVWLNEQTIGVINKERFGQFSTKKRGPTHKGPYVNLEQLDERVTARAKEISKNFDLEIGQWDPSLGIAYAEIVNELRKGSNEH